MDDLVRQRRLALFETLNTVCWVSLDISWFHQANLAAVLFAIPTVLTCLAIIGYTEKQPVALIVAAAVTFWAHFNVFWVLGDLKMLDWGLPVARVFIALLVASLGAASIAASLDKNARAMLLTRFRRVRLGNRR